MCIKCCCNVLCAAYCICAIYIYKLSFFPAFIFTKHFPLFLFFYFFNVLRILGGFSGAGFPPSSSVRGVEGGVDTGVVAVFITAGLSNSSGICIAEVDFCVVVAAVCGVSSSSSSSGGGGAANAAIARSLFWRRIGFLAKASV